jgi:colanic acid/amylovoran biosynthesis glycosyltransferase
MTGLGSPRRRLRVLVLTSTLPAVPGDGTPEFVLTLSQALAESFAVTILSPRVPLAPLRERQGDVAIVRFPYFPRRWEGLADGAILPNLKAHRWRLLEVPPLMGSFRRHALRLAREMQPDVVHAHWMIPAGMVAMSLKRRLGIPYVLTVHGADAYALQGRVFRAMKARVSREAHTVSAVSRDIASVIGLPEAEAAALTVPMGVDVEAIRGVVGERSPVHGRFLFVGRLAEKKGVDVLVEAMDGVAGGSLVVVGDGPERPALESLATRVGVASRVTFTGRLPKARVMDQLRQAHALVIPSRVARSGDQEGTPVVLAEAMAAGVPVIASRLGGMAELVQPGLTGLVVEPGSVRSLREALVEALTRPDDLRRLATEAAERMPQTLDIGVTSDRYRRFIESAASSSLRPASP